MKTITTVIYTDKLLFLLLFICMGVFSISGQNIPKQVLTLEQGNIAYRNLKFSQAAGCYENYLKGANPGASDDIWKKLADCYWQMRDYPQALRVYQKLYPQPKGAASEQEQFRIGELYARSGDYTNASKWLEGIPGYSGKAKAYSHGRISAMKRDSLLWKVGYLNLNTPYREFCPLLIDSTLLFCSNRPLVVRKKVFGWDGSSFSRLWQAKVSQLQVVGSIPSESQLQDSTKRAKDVTIKKLAGVYAGSDNKILPGTKNAFIPDSYIKASTSYIGTPIEGMSGLEYNVGGISADKDNDIYFSSNYPKPDKRGVNRIRLMAGHYNGTTIENIHPLPFGDANAYSVMHPAINSEGTILIFSSDKPGGQGGYDLYYSKRENKQQPWWEPFPLPGKINTAGNEVFPSITPDGWLYYSSDGKAGLGGLDIYRIKLDDAIAGIGDSEHLPYPINSSSDDFGWTQDKNELSCYFSSDRITSEDNIYSARYDDNVAKAKLRRTIEGFVLDRQTMAPLKEATVFLLSKCDGKVRVGKTNEQGKFDISIATTPCDLAIKAIKKNYTDDCLTMTATTQAPTDSDIQKMPHDLLLDRFHQGVKWTLNNIHYDFDKWNIRADARPTLDSLVAILKTYPIKVELSSYTDSRGSDAYNDNLSQQRAKAAVAYIVSKGADPARITAKGYGKRQLLNKCATGVPCSEADHQVNRRTEIKVIVGQEHPQTPDSFDPAQFKDGQQTEVNNLPDRFFDSCK